MSVACSREVAEQTNSNIHLLVDSVFLLHYIWYLLSMVWQEVTHFVF